MIMMNLKLNRLFAHLPALQMPNNNDPANVNKTTFTRPQLYDLVWARPLLTLSKQYNISDVGLRKICIRMGIPLPVAGHWSKIKAVKSPAIKPLPKDFKGEKEVILALREEGKTQVEDGQSKMRVLGPRILVKQIKEQLQKTLDNYKLSKTNESI
jgi:hypothetical protein